MGKIKKVAGNIPPLSHDISVKAECYRVLAETAQDVFMILDSRGALLYVNTYGGELLGVTPEAIIGKTLSDLFPEDIAQNMLANIRKVFNEGCPQDVEDMIPSVNGPLWFATRLVPLSDDEGSVNTVIGIARDITSRKKTEAALADTHDFLKNIMECTTNSIYALDLQGNVTFANSRAVEITGYPLDELIGKPFSICADEKSLSMASALFQEVTAHGRKFADREFEIIRKDGVRRTVILGGAPMIRAGKIVGYVGAAEDITYRKQAEMVLRNNEEQLRVLSENIADGMVYQINSGVDGRQRRFTYISPAVERLHGLKVEDVMKNPMLLYGQVIEDDRAQVAKQEERAFATRTKLDVDVRVLLPSGAVRWRRFTSSPRDLPDGSVVWDGIEVDVTERKKMEEELRESIATARTLLDIPNTAAFLLDREGSCLEANEELCRRFGKRLPDIIGKPIWDLFPPGVRETRRKYFQEAIRRKQQVRFEDKRGEIWSEAIVTPILSETGEVSKVSVLAFDITERKRTEEALRESERRATHHALELEESFSALKVIMKQRENDRKEMEEKILSNLKQLIFPYLERLKKNKKASEELTYLNILESNLKEIISPFAAKYSSRYVGLTPKEILIANLIRDGKQDKDISEILGIAVDTVKVHRKSIRKKLGITGNRANLRTFLLTNH